MIWLKLCPAICICPSIAPIAAHCAMFGAVVDLPLRRLTMQAGLR